MHWIKIKIKMAIWKHVRFCLSQRSLQPSQRLVSINTRAGIYGPIGFGLCISDLEFRDLQFCMTYVIFYSDNEWYNWNQHMCRYALRFGTTYEYFTEEHFQILQIPGNSFSDVEHKLATPGQKCGRKRDHITNRFSGF